MRCQVRVFIPGARIRVLVGQKSALRVVDGTEVFEKANATSYPYCILSRPVCAALIWHCALLRGSGTNPHGV